MLHRAFDDEIECARRKHRMPENTSVCSCSRKIASFRSAHVYRFKDGLYHHTRSARNRPVINSPNATSSFDGPMFIYATARRCLQVVGRDIGPVGFYKNSKISSERLRQSANSTLVACTRAQKRFLSAATIFAPGRMLITTACATPQPEARFRGVFGYPRKIFGGKMSVGLAVKRKP